ncbi:hypothetical protein [Streptomyces sp. KL116D]|uniref:hypothetical protein n=1 Tax=Streptomyces sp. KL116D TaxID=3045152 RepID=UPI0035582BA2
MAAYAAMAPAYDHVVLDERKQTAAFLSDQDGIVMERCRGWNQHGHRAGHRAPADGKRLHPGTPTRAVMPTSDH